MPNDNSLTTGYAPVNGLNAYFEIHGAGEPLVLLHGAYMNVDGMVPLLRPLAEHRQVIALELQVTAGAPTLTVRSPTRGWPTTPLR